MKQREKIRHGSLGSSSMVEHIRPGDIVVDVIVVLLVGIVGFMCIIPFWHVLMSSLSDGKTLYAHEGMVWWPVGGITLDGFRQVFKNGDIVKGFFNSVFYTFIIPPQIPIPKAKCTWSTSRTEDSARSTPPCGAFCTRVTRCTSPSLMALNRGFTESIPR